ncbi:hypothetical protein FKP32DRAFT_1605742 [Trametes sanguinea]|nr:hypothetical protein FKP32DRAFT_1605742 [Trametes sanguinea]
MVLSAEGGWAIRGQYPDDRALEPSAGRWVRRKFWGQTLEEARSGGGRALEDIEGSRFRRGDKGERMRLEGLARHGLSDWEQGLIVDAAYEDIRTTHVRGKFELSHGRNLSSMPRRPCQASLRSPSPIPRRYLMKDEGGGVRGLDGQAPASPKSGATLPRFRKRVCAAASRDLDFSETALNMAAGEVLAGGLATAVPGGLSVIHNGNRRANGMGPKMLGPRDDRLDMRTSGALCASASCTPGAEWEDGVFDSEGRSSSPTVGGVEGSPRCPVHGDERDFHARANARRTRRESLERKDLRRLECRWRDGGRRSRSAVSDGAIDRGVAALAGISAAEEAADVRQQDDRIARGRGCGEDGLEGGRDRGRTSSREDGLAGENAATGCRPWEYGATALRGDGEMERADDGTFPMRDQQLY